MKAVVQRVKACSVRVGDTRVARIGKGLLVFLGIGHQDRASDAEYLAKKIVHLRIFEDAGGKTNRSLLDVAGRMLVVSQFTLYGDCRKGRRPSFIAAAPPDRAEGLYLSFVASVRKAGVEVETGRFQAKMEVSLTNDGPVTLLLESPE